MDLPRGTVTIDLDAMGVRTGDAEVEKLRSLFQALIDEREKVRNLSNDDPRKDADPATASEFYEGQGGNKDLVTRTSEVVVRWHSVALEFEFLFRPPGRTEFQFGDEEINITVP